MLRYIKGMLRRIFGNLIPAIDRLIERIPPHIRDIIQKASLAFAALIALLVIISGINKGLREAKPAGYKLVERNRDLFYLQEMREEYAKKRKLVEDVEVDPLQFPSRQQAADETKFAAMGRDTMGHLMGEKEEMLKHEDVMRPKEKSPGYLGDSYTVPRLTPDKKTIEEDEAHGGAGFSPGRMPPEAKTEPHLTKEKIGSRPQAAAEPAQVQKASPVAPAGRDIFDDNDAAKRPAASVPEKKAPPAKSSAKMEFMD